MSIIPVGPTHNTIVTNSEELEVGLYSVMGDIYTTHDTVMSNSEPTEYDGLDPINSLSSSSHAVTLESGSLFYTGGPKKNGVLEGPKVLVSGATAWREATPEEIKEGNIKSLQLHPKQDSTEIFTRDGYNGNYISFEDGAVYFSGGTTTSGNPVEPQIYENGQWREPTQNEREAAEAFISEHDTGYLTTNDYALKDERVL